MKLINSFAENWCDSNIFVDSKHSSLEGKIEYTG